MSEPTQKEILERIAKHSKAVQRNPRDAAAHALLGLAHLRNQDREAGIKSLQRALELNPKIRDIHSVLAGALFELRRYPEAEKHYRAALRHQDNVADLHQRLAECLSRTERAEEAEASALRALELAPDDIPCMLTYAAVLHGMKRQDAARDVLRDVEVRRDLSVEERFDLGRLQYHTGDYAAAMRQMESVIAERGDDAEALQFVGLSQRQLQQREDALLTLRRAAEAAPDDKNVLNELSEELLNAGKTAEAIAVAEKVFQLDPDNARAIGFMMTSYFNVGRFEESLEMAYRMMEHFPSATGNSAMLFILSNITEDPELLTREHFAFGERWEQPLIAARKPHSNSRDPERVLRVGLVSADFNNHALARFITPVLEAWRTHTRLEVYAYYNNSTEDPTTEHIRATVPFWRSIHGVSDEQAEQMIRDDGIDILIDLSGHSAMNRLPLFARKPAPLQVTWMGYTGTTGLRAMDYILADQFLMPGTRYSDQFTEKIIKLPLGAPFQPEGSAPPINDLPALKNGYLTFGSFHRINKLSEKVIQQWATLLHAIPTSRMLLGGQTTGTEETLTAWFEKAGIARERLDFRPRCGIRAYLAMHHEVDIALCPSPYTGGTTVAHALWMGVPTLTTYGATNPSQAAASLMIHLGLDTFVTNSQETYVMLGKFLSENLSPLAALRASMRERFTQSALGYPGLVAASVELALRRIWQQWCKELPPVPMEVRLRDLVPEQADEAAQPA